MRRYYELYQKHLGRIPSFMNKYLKLDILERLKDISLLCGMDYSSKKAYDFDFYISRYDHSCNVALINWYLTHDKVSTLAALFHDVASPVFSHVIDYMNGDFLEQESTEEKTEEILRGSKELALMLEIDGLKIEDILDFKRYPIVDSKRPRMCADRLDNTIAVGMSWVKSIDLDMALEIMDKVKVFKNEDGVDEIGFTDIHVAEVIRDTGDAIDALTHSNNDTYMMLLVAKIVKRCIVLNLVNYDDLFRMGEHDIMSIIERNKEADTALNALWEEFKNIEEFPIIKQPEIKKRDIDPLVLTKRLSSCK